MPSTAEAVDILLIDDCPSDSEIFALVVGEIAPAVRVESIANGNEALEFLRNANNPRPKLIVLDAYLPSITGLEVLKQIRQNLKLLTPVILLSSSRWESDIREAYQAGANSWLSKPPDLNSFRELVNAVVKLWIRFAEYPASALANGASESAPVGRRH